ncbi:MAG: hypothetical protein ABIN89_03120 [Chitinophagaceae bacterium]
MKHKNANGGIASTEDLKKELHNTRLRILQKEDELRKRVRQVPGELFYSGMDSIIPSMLTGKVSSFALNAGKGLINNFFVRKAVSAGSFKLLRFIRPSGIARSLGSGIRAVIKKKK